MYETYTPFTVGVIFMLYYIFKSITVVKPFNTSFLSNRQYVVCKGLKCRRPKEMLGYLIGVLRNLEAEGKDEFTKCIGLFRYMENEDKFLTYIKNHAQALTSLQTQLFAAAQYRKESLDADCFKFKTENLKAWGLPIKQKNEKYDPRDAKYLHRSNDPTHEFANMDEDQRTRIIETGDNILEHLEVEQEKENRERRRRRRRDREEKEKKI